MGELREIVAIRRKEIVDGIERHLKHDPSRESRSRIKKLNPPPLGEFCLRVGEFRVFYDVLLDERVVLIQAVWEKGRSTLSEVTNGPNH
ncbi:MAG: type II toxin-antitoxin system RelE family toxin [Phycisphaerae bacterium]